MYIKLSLQYFVRYLSVQVRNPFKEIWNIQQHWGRIGLGLVLKNIQTVFDVKKLFVGTKGPQNILFPNAMVEHSE